MQPTRFTQPRTSGIRAGALLLAAALLTAGCSWFQFPGVYRLSIDQGNIITQEMVDQLEPGMTRRQVNFVLGTPLVTDSFHPNRWDYVHRVQRPDGEVERKRLTVFFENDQLSHFTGDYQPSDAEASESADTGESTDNNG